MSLIAAAVPSGFAHSSPPRDTSASVAKGRAKRSADDPLGNELRNDVRRGNFLAELTSGRSV
eukprot:5070268-Pyramimonas_sp.AAC.1